jgi:hypothetical protein
LKFEWLNNKFSKRFDCCNDFTFNLDMSQGSFKGKKIKNQKSKSLILAAQILIGICKVESGLGFISFNI